MAAFDDFNNWTARQGAQFVGDAVGFVAPVLGCGLVNLSNTNGLFSDSAGFLAGTISIFGKSKADQGLFAKLRDNLWEGLQKAGQGVQIGPATDMGSNGNLVGAPASTPMGAVDSGLQLS